MKTKRPCLDCTNHKLKCHSTCELYLNSKKPKSKRTQDEIELIHYKIDRRRQLYKR